MKPVKLMAFFLTKNNTLITCFSISIALIIITIGCNRQVNENVESTYEEENVQKKITQTEAIPELNKLQEVVQDSSKNISNLPYDKYYGEKKFKANYISEYGMKFSELTFLIDTNYLEACPGHFSQIAFYVTAPARPQITFKRISGPGKIVTRKSNEESGKQTVGNFQFRSKIKEIGTHIIEIKATVGIKGEADYMEKIHQITIEAACKSTCPPFTEKIIPTYAIPRILPYDVYITSTENNTAASNKNNCKTAIDIEFKDPTNEAIKYQIFEGISHFIDNPVSKQVHNKSAPAFSGVGNGKQSGICNGAYFIELTDPKNGCRTHKAFEILQGLLINEDQHIFKTDTVYEEIYGSKYKVINNPHPYIEYIKTGEMDYFKIKFRENTPNNHKMTKEEVIGYIKQIINFDETVDSLSFNEFESGEIYHKGIRVIGFYIDFEYNEYKGYYFKGLDINVKNVITKEAALKIGKQKAIELGITIADSNQMAKRLEHLKRLHKNRPDYLTFDTIVAFEIHKFNDKFIPCYRFKLYAKRFFANPIFTISALNGDVLKTENDAIHKCLSCNESSVIEETDCELTHPHNIEPSSFACDLLSETHKFTNFPGIFDGCSSIDNVFDKCTIVSESISNEVVWLSGDKIIAVEGDDLLLEYYSPDNTSYNEKDVQILTAFKNTEQVFNYYTARISSEDDLREAIPFVFISAAYSTTNNASADPEGLRLLFGDGSDENCKPNVSPNLVAHEFTHLFLRNYCRMTFKTDSETFNQLVSAALEEAICDIMAVLFTYAKNNSIDWSLFDELCPGLTCFRLLNDPEKSDPPQKILYEEPLNFDFEKYNWAGIITYWFYLMTEPKYKEVNDVVIGEGVGAMRAEKLMLKTLEKIKETIVSKENPLNEMFFDSTVSFKEFRDVALTAAEEIFFTPNSDYNLCSPEYSKVYLAFKAVGLIDDIVKPPCNILTFDENIIANCPSPGTADDQYNCSPSFGSFQLTTGFPSSLSNNPAGEKWLIQKAVDTNENGSFELDEFLEEEFTEDITTTRVTIDGLRTEDVKVKLIVTNVTAISNGVIGEIVLPSFQYIFSCNNSCNLITDINFTGHLNEPPATNTGNISIVAATNYEACAGRSICIDYNVIGPAYMYVDIIGGNFTKTIQQPGANTTGQFCWSPTIADLGTNTFKITATDGHPTQPLKNNKTIHIEVETYNASCICAGEHAEKTLSLHNNIRIGHYTALKDLDSDARVYGSSDVLFKAGSSVTLNGGFYVPPSTQFSAFIENCTKPEEDINSPK